MKTSDIRQMKPVDMAARLAEAEASLSELKFKQGMSQLENPLQIRQLKKDIARLRTLMREAELNSGREGQE